MRLQAASSSNDKHAYRVHRWRIHANDEPQQDPAASKTMKETYNNPIAPEKSQRDSKHSILESVPRNHSTLGLDINSRATCQSRIKQSLSADNLLHLIHYNTFRGLCSNKYILGTATVSWEPETQPEQFDKAFPGFSVVLPFAPGLPSNLNPSESQMKILHSTWINLIPFTAMRENLIRWETFFDHKTFAQDLVGDVAHPDLFSQPRYTRLEMPVKANYLLSGDEDDDEVTANRKGWILWGEPYDVNSWEVTPGFLRKWAWAMQGCEELILSSNRWRRIRGEDPLCFSMRVETFE